ncbi:MAG: polyketide synthase [Planctomycetota bacterium]
MSAAIPNDRTDQPSRFHEPLDPSLSELLQRLRDKIRRYIVWDTALAVVAVTLTVFWVALAVDYLPVRLGGTEMPRSARTVVLVGLFMVIAWLLWKSLLQRLTRPLPDESLALLIERHHPDLGGRLTTAVELTSRARDIDSSSDVLLRQVHRDASSSARNVDIARVLRWQPIRKKIWLLTPLLMALLAMATVAPRALGHAVGRLMLLSDSPWPRLASLEMVGVEVPVIRALDTELSPTRLQAFEGDRGRQTIRLARGGSTTLRIRAANEDRGHVVPDVCTAMYVTDAGVRGQSNLRRVGRVINGYQSFVLDGPPVATLTDSVELTIRGLDSSLRGYRIEAVEPPSLVELQLAIRYPDYLRAGAVSETKFDQAFAYEAGVRIREGSTLVFRGVSNRALGAVDVAIDAMNSLDSADDADAIISDDGLTFAVELQGIRSPVTARFVPQDADGISVQAPYRYFVGIVQDQPPEVTMRLRGIGTMITPIADIPVEATVTDDYAVATTDLIVAIRGDVAGEREQDGETDDSSSSLKFQPARDRFGKTQWNVDLRTLSEQKQIPAPQPGQRVQIVMSASDDYDLDGVHQVDGETFQLEVVTAEELLAKLEGRELEFRSRLEQLIDETRRLRQGIAALRDNALDWLGTTPAPAEPSVDETDSPQRARQRFKLRIRQSELQIDKSSEELAGIVAGVDDLLLEMINNRVDSVDRRERLTQGVRDPLDLVTREPIPRLKRQIGELQDAWPDEETQSSDGTKSEIAREQLTELADRALVTNDEVLRSLQAVLEKMLDLESFNEILDMVRGLIDDQEEISEETSKQREESVLDLFK